MFWRGRIKSGQPFELRSGGTVKVVGALMRGGLRGRVKFSVDGEELDLLDVHYSKIEYPLALTIATGQRITFKVDGDASVWLYGHIDTESCDNYCLPHDNILYQRDKAKIYGELSSDEETTGILL
ncbi:uncharacterized protein LOC115621710 [Scaptodrosophila lebanonensis]|uniref:Uncharacterized protein LOC115621710 n=1 Tax=Drosophila lebanonensis TaxID=7225 RepID=A0A6J2T5H0_DROLE|nr:uncharacterized protein LOC115621710 [Scaptodrosophila lebanonensis]